MPITGSVRAVSEKKHKLYTLEACQDSMFQAFHQGKVKGTTTYIEDIDKLWKWRLQEFNLWTGYYGEGKSQVIRFLALIKALVEGWVFLFAAPEDFPPEEFYDDLIHTLVGLSTDKDHQHQMPEDWYIRAADLIRTQIYFVYTSPTSTVQDVLDAFAYEMDEFDKRGRRVQCCVIDPLIKFRRPSNVAERDDIYAQHVTTISTDFCRRMDLSLHLVLHQLTPRLIDTGYYPKPSGYNIKGGGTWVDGSDNVLSVWRPEFAKDKTSNIVKLSSLKIKKQKLVGIPQDFDLKFNRKANRYVSFQGERDLFDFDELFQRRAMKSTKK